MIDGLIVKGIAGFYSVKTEKGVYQCKARGVFKKDGVVPMVGDNVKMDVLKDGSGIIRAIDERKNAFIRPPISNVDCLIVVISVREPAPQFLMVDRLLTAAEKNGAEALLCVNKIDIAPPDALSVVSEIYGALYPVIFVSGKTGEGLGALEEAPDGQKRALAGPSGTGKSTLVNALAAQARAEVGSVSKRTSQGRHTTRHVEIFETLSGAMIYDTPGFTSFDAADARPEELRQLYPEMAKAAPCRFRDCRHLIEPGCEVREAVSAGLIHASRYSSYVKQYEELVRRAQR